MNKLSKKNLKAEYRNKAIIGGIFCIKCLVNNTLWLRTTTNMQSSKNRFCFSLVTNSCPEPCMLTEWKKFGASSFTFEVLEEIKKKTTQTESEFTDDVHTLLELHTEKKMLITQGKDKHT
ncbi:MAG: GIY-YIG nuclease family protein [Acidaminococcaceae bacterium]